MTHLSAYIINNKLQTIKKDISEEEITMSKKRWIQQHRFIW